MNDYTLYLVKRAYYKKQLIKQAASYIESFTNDPEKIKQYNEFKPKDYLDNFPGTSYKGTISHSGSGLYFDDPKARDVSVESTGFDERYPGYNKLWSAIGYDISPATNLINMDRNKKVDDKHGHVVDDLMLKGYNHRDLGNLGLKDDPTAVMGNLGKDLGDLDKIKGRASGTIYVDDQGNAVNRSKGIQHGRFLGSTLGLVGGGVGGGYLGNKGTKWLNRKLGLTKDRGKLRHFIGGSLNAIGTLGGVVGGSIGGTILGNRLGEAIGGYIDPQKGNAMRIYDVSDLVK